MDFVEINKLTQSGKVRIARDNVYNLSKITIDDSVILITYACRKMYGLKNTAKIIHALGVDNIRSQL